jgi:hypothetical protein
MKAMLILNMVLWAYIWWALKLTQHGRLVKRSYRWRLE